jgi:PAS domain S-box-containing protein
LKTEHFEQLTLLDDAPLYRTLVEQLPLAVYVFAVDDGFRPLYRSPQIEPMLGYSTDEWLRDPDLFPKLLHPEDRDRVMAEVERADAAGEPFAAEFRMVARDGRVVWVHDEHATIRDAAGRPTYVQGYMVDVTERKEAEEGLRSAEVHYRTLVEQLPLAVYIDALDEVSSALYMSPQIESMLGYPVQQWLDDRELFAKLLHPEDRERVLARVAETQETGEKFCEEYRLIAKDGRVVWIRDEDVVITGRDGTPLHSQGYMLDISGRKRVEAELERLLDKERAQNDELRTLDKLKDEFIALVSHELRTPLTSIRGYLELVSDGGELSEEQEHFLGVVSRNAERLQSLVGDLLFVAQIEAGRLQLETSPVDLEQIAADAVESARPLADQKQIELTTEVHAVPRFEGDRGRLGQLLDNFLSNAIKFTPEGGSVRVRLGLEDGNAVLEIADTGMGIPQAEQERLFERFFRTSNATAQAIQGTGLGLTISKAIAEAHGGRITFTSIEGKGTTFRIELPLAGALAAAA